MDRGTNKNVQRTNEMIENWTFKKYYYKQVVTRLFLFSSNIKIWLLV